MSAIANRHYGIDSLGLTSGQLSWIDRAYEFCQQVPLSKIIECDEISSFDYSLFEKACMLGFGSLPFVADFGGQNGDYVSFAMVNEVMARMSNPIMSSLGVHVLCQEPIYKFGTESQKKKYLIPSSSGRYLGAFGLTEPEAGSDTANIQTWAKRVDNGYIINGSKVFITSGASCNYLITMARLIEENSDVKDTITSFIVDSDSKGFSIGQKFDMLGMRGYSTCEIVFNDCFVPQENLLGQHFQGRKVALSSLAKGRVTIASQCVGWAYGAISAFKVIQQTENIALTLYDITKLGELISLTDSARLKTIEVARLIDSGNLSVKESSIAKWHASDVAMHVVSEIMNMLGPSALKKEYLLEKIYRDTKAGQIYEGTNQIQRLIVSKNLD